MKKFWKISLIILGSLLAIVCLFLGGSYINNQSKLKKEAKQIESYGEQLDVFDGKINVVRSGKDKNKENILLFPGYGTASPYYDFLPVTTKLEKDFNVIVVEPFGYGLSSQTKRKRSIENIVEEMHEVITQLDMDHYILGGHSITGLYGVNYLNRYKDENVTGFLGIDTSVPTQKMESMNMAPFNFLKKSGIMRLYIDSNPAKGLGMKEDDPNVDQVRMITLKNSISDNLEEELDLLSENFQKTEKMELPKDLPTLMFVAINDGRDDWVPEHQKQMKQVTNGKMIELKGHHYLHRTQSKAIAEESNKFFNK